MFSYMMQKNWSNPWLHYFMFYICKYYLYLKVDSLVLLVKWKWLKITINLKCKLASISMYIVHIHDIKYLWRKLILVTFFLVLCLRPKKLFWKKRKIVFVEGIQNRRVIVILIDQVIYLACSLQYLARNPHSKIERGEFVITAVFFNGVGMRELGNS